MAFTRVQGKEGGSGDTTSATTVAVTITAVGSGNLICGMVSWATGGGTLNSVTDDKGNTYNLETPITDTTFGQIACAFSLTNITNAPSTITANFSSSSNFSKIIVDEFSGGSTASSDERDGTAHGGQLQASPGTGIDGISSGPFTTATDGDLLYGCTVNTVAATLESEGTSFSAGVRDTTGTFYSIQSEYRTQTTHGSGTAATFTQGTNDAHITYLISIKPPGATTPAPPGPFAVYSFAPPPNPVYCDFVFWAPFLPPPAPTGNDPNPKAAFSVISGGGRMVTPMIGY